MKDSSYLPWAENLGIIKSKVIFSCTPRICLSLKNIISNHYLFKKILTTGRLRLRNNR